MKEMCSLCCQTGEGISDTPPKVEYSLSERGKSLVPVLVAMCKWGGEHRDDK